MSKDKFNLRSALLGVSNSDKNTDRNISVTIAIQRCVPVISQSQHSTGNDEDATEAEDIKYDLARARVYVGQTEDDDILNVLVDPDDTDRYVAMGIIVQVGTGNSYVVYYDNEYGDMFYVPNLRLIGDTSVSLDYMVNRHINVEGIAVGGYRGNVPGSDAYVCRYTEVVKMPKPKDTLLKTASHLLPVQANKGADIYGITSFMLDVGFAESHNVQLGSFASLGTNTTILEGKVPTHRLINVGGMQYRLVYVGLQNVSDMLIPILP